MIKWINDRRPTTPAQDIEDALNTIRRRTTDKVLGIMDENGDFFF